MIVWKSQLNSEMVEHLSEIDLVDLFNQLDEVIQEVAETFGVK